MGKFSRDPNKQERDIYRALVVQEYRDADALEYLGRDW